MLYHFRSSAFFYQLRYQSKPITSGHLEPPKRFLQKGLFQVGGSTTSLSFTEGLDRDNWVGVIAEIVLCKIC